MKDIWAEFRPNIFIWQGLVRSVPVDSNHAEERFSHILSNRAFVFIDYHGLCVVWAFPWTEATCPIARCFNNCQRFAMSTKFQVQIHYIANSTSTKWKKKSKTVPITFHILPWLWYFFPECPSLPRHQYIYI